MGEISMTTRRLPLAGAAAVAVAITAAVLLNQSSGPSRPTEALERGGQSKVGAGPDTSQPCQPLPADYDTYTIRFPGSNGSPIVRTCAGCCVPIPNLDESWDIIITGTKGQRPWCRPVSLCPAFTVASNVVRVTITSPTTPPPPAAPYRVPQATYPGKQQPGDRVVLLPDLRWELLPADGFMPAGAVVCAEPTCGGRVKG